MRQIKINLEDFKSRTNGKSMYINMPEEGEADNWGKLPYDLIVPDDKTSLIEIADNIPIYFMEDDKGDMYAVLRYQNMLRLFYWLKTLFEESRFYNLCQRNGKKIWVNIEYNKKTKEEKEEIKEGIKGVFDEFPYNDDFEIGDYIWVGEGCIEFENIFSANSDDTISEMFDRYEAFIELVSDAFDGNLDAAEPYANVSVYLEETTTDMGLFSPLAEQWIPNKRYYEGEVVFYGECAYKLYDNVSDPLEIDEEGKKFYKGYYDEDLKITYFDKSEELHWRKIISDTSYIETESTIMIGESKLMSLKRNKKDYDDYGNLLPFYVNSDYTTDLQFTTDVLYNIVKEGEAQFCDYISSIVIDDTANTITFTYYIKGELNGIKYSGGIKYKESYLYEDKELTTRYDGIERTFTYKDIIFETLIDFDDAEEGKLYSEIEITNEQKSEDEFQDIPYIMDESMLGINNLKIDVSGYNIERGISAAYEKHNVLGECCTMDDLEKYRNDFFKIKSNEND